MNKKEQLQQLKDDISALDNHFAIPGNDGYKLAVWSRIRAKVLEKTLTNKELYEKVKNIKNK